MSRGVFAQILLLAIITMLLVGITVVALAATGSIPADDKGDSDSYGLLAWKSLMHALDAGTLSGDNGGWSFLFIMLFITIGGLFCPR
jgi:hypothetical protein